MAALAPFIGVWVGRGDGRYPTISPFSYTEEIELRPVPGKPLLAYRSATRAADDGRTLHGESGFWRLVGPDLVEVVVAQGAGLVEIGEGVLDTSDGSGDGSAEVIVSGTVAGTSTAKEVSATERRYRVEADRLTYELAMAAVGQPLQHHLRGELTRRLTGRSEVDLEPLALSKLGHLQPLLFVFGWTGQGRLGRDGRRAGHHVLGRLQVGEGCADRGCRGWCERACHAGSSAPTRTATRSGPGSRRGRRGSG